MGVDKRFLLSEGGPLLARAIALARRFTDEVLLSANDPERLVEFGAPVVPDRLEGGGPVLGIHAGLLAASRDLVLVLACDAPHVSPVLVERLRRESPRGDVVCGATAGGVEPLPGLYRRRCAAAIEEALSQGRRRVVDFFSSVQARILPPEETALADPGGRSYLNLNEPADLAAVGGGTP